MGDERILSSRVTRGGSAERDNHHLLHHTHPHACMCIHLYAIAVGGSNDHSFKMSGGSERNKISKPVQLHRLVYLGHL